MKKRRHHVIFVAFGRKDASLWRKYLPLLKKDASLQSGLELTQWPDQASTPRKRRLREWLSPVARRAERLRRHLEKEPFVDIDPNTDPDLTLVGMGKGCCVVQAYILQCLQEDETVRYVRRIRQVVLVNPSRVRRYRMLVVGSIIAMILIPLLQILNNFTHQLHIEAMVIVLGSFLAVFYLFFGIVSNSSAMELLGLKPIRLDRDDLDRQFRERVIDGDKNKAGTWPIAHQEVAIENTGEDEGSDADRLAKAILHVPGHKNVYELDLLERRIAISPLPKPPPADELGVGTVDNTAAILHRALFSACNATTEESAVQPWELRYQSYGGKIQINVIPNPNRWTPQERSAFQHNHDKYVFRFVPEASQEYSLDVTLWNGYTRGNRDSHMHLRADAYFRRLLLVLDLRAYLDARWKISRSPEAYFFFGKIPLARGKNRDLDGPSCDCLKNKRNLEDGLPVEVGMIESGVYQWEVEDVRDGGVLGFIFDVTAEENGQND